MNEWEKPNPGIGFTWIIELLIKIMASLLPIISPHLRKALEEFLTDLYKKASETPNPWDDFLVKFLLRMLLIPIPE